MRIRHLPDNLINQIAAGEVIERPAAAVKELVENSLDADSGMISVDLEAGGKARITVMDDGFGMGRQDLHHALDRHATSKLPTEDLSQISSLGFRGEALPSIASVARVQIDTRLRGADEAWSLRVEGGVRMPALPSAHPNGTRIDVRDLFFSTPARLKFLKSDRAEYLAVRDVLYRLALARPDVGFKLTHDGRTSLNVERNQGLATRIHDILGNDFLQACIDIDAKRESVQLKGLVGLPTFHRANALDQYVFVNGRPVRDKILSSAVRGAYADVMPSGRHPAVVLFLNVPPEDVDVNVHPAKSEVRFKDAALIRGLIVGSIRHAVAQQMRTHVAVGPSIVNHASVDVSAARTIGFSDSAAQETFVSGFQNAFQPQARVSQPDYAHPQSQIQEFPLGAALAQIHGTYVLSQTMNGMVITDQHAAHERLVYERLKGQMSQGGVIRQGLLVPVIVDVRPDEAEVLLSFSSEVLGCGLEIEPFGKDALCVQSVPALLGSAADVAKLVKELAQIACESLHDSGHPADVLQEEIFKVLSRAACYGSVRAGRILNISEMNALLREMEQTPNSAQCNHGRPTHISLDLKQIERLFARR